jgi:predicted nucleotidyltransferase
MLAASAICYEQETFMKRDQVIQVLQSQLPELATSFGVRKLAILGSVARDAAREGSDVDVLVEFDRPTGLFSFIRLKHRIEEMLGRPVDLGTFDGIRPALRETILREAIRVA